MQREKIISTLGQSATQLLSKTSSQLLYCVITLLVSSTALGETLNCPKQDSPHLIAMNYQLFTAYQTGFDGYEASCDLQCFSKENCQKDCQAKKGREYLQKQMTQLAANFTGSCENLINTCLSQCQDQGPSCSQACSGT